MRLVAQALNHVQSRAGAVEQEAFLAVWQHDFLDAFGQAEHGDGQPQRVHGVLRRGKLAAAAVDENQIRHFPEFSLRFAQAVGKAAGDNLVHGGKVVRAHHSLDAEVAVFLARGSAVDHHHHGGHGQRPLRVGNIVSLNAARIGSKAKHALQFLRRAHGALAASGELFAALFRLVAGIFERHGHQFALFAAHGGDDIGAAAVQLRQKLLEHVPLRRLRRKDELLRGHIFRVVVLQDKLQDGLAGQL